MFELPGLPDGMAGSSNGTIIGSGPAGIYVTSPEGNLLDRLITGGRTCNCTFNDDESVLYITNDDKILRVQLKPSN